MCIIPGTFYQKSKTVCQKLAKLSQKGKEVTDVPDFSYGEREREREVMLGMRIVMPGMNLNEMSSKKRTKE